MAKKFTGKNKDFETPAWVEGEKGRLKRTHPIHSAATDRPYGRIVRMAGGRKRRRKAAEY